MLTHISIYFKVGDFANHRSISFRGWRFTHHLLGRGNWRDRPGVRIRQSSGSCLDVRLLNPTVALDCTD
jgi:hypothetical protein